MKPLYRSKFDIFWDGVFIVVSAVMLLEVPFFIYAPTSEMYFEYQTFLLPIIGVALGLFYSFTLRFIVIFPTMLVFERPFGISNRKIVIATKDITQVELEYGKRSKLNIYHQANETSILLYDSEIPDIKKAFAQAGITVE
ncbi:MAG: hypothetical protein HYV29_14395 [Ignavibacteriales bacterium]|nr:hypothetical protein [Ignavibacteriales bacterium]